MSQTGIVDYDVYLPRTVITADAYRAARHRFAARIEEKRVPAIDEDAVTMAINAAQELDTEGIETLAAASTTWPQPGTTVSGPLITALGLPSDVRALEFGTSWRAGIEAIDTALALGEGLVIVSDEPRADPSTDIEHRLGAGAAAFRTGHAPIAALQAGAHHSTARSPTTITQPSGVTDLGLGQYSTDGIRVAVCDVVESVLDSCSILVEDIGYAVFPQLEVKEAWRLGTALGFTEPQLTPGFRLPEIGFAGAAATPIGLAAALDAATSGEYILHADYAPGHGATALVYETTDRIQTTSTTVETSLDQRTETEYADYLAMTEAI